MAYRDPDATITAVDNRAALDAAESTAHSIGLGECLTVVEGDPLEVELESDAFDWVIIPQRFSCLSPATASRLLRKAADAAKPGGRVALIDLFRIPGKANLTDCVEKLLLQLVTREGAIRTLEQVEDEFREAGLGKPQVALISKSRSKLGLAVATKTAGD